MVQRELTLRRVLIIFLVLLTGCMTIAKITGGRVIGSKKVCESPEFRGTWMPRKDYVWQHKISCRGRGDPHRDCKNARMEIYFPNDPVLVPVPGCLLPLERAKESKKQLLEYSDFGCMLEERDCTDEETPEEEVKEEREDHFPFLVLEE